MDDVVFLAHLNKYPALRKRMEEILNVAGDLTENLDLADDAEGALIENSRHLNREALQAWASNKAAQAAVHFEKKHRKAHKDEPLVKLKTFRPCNGAIALKKL